MFGKGGRAARHSKLISRNRNLLRSWWHGVLRDHGKYKCYSLLLALPSDKDAIKYFTQYGDEIDQLAGKNCLIIALGDSEIRRSGFDSKIWKASIKNQISKGYSIDVSKLFNISFAEFPCLIIFSDIRNPRHILISLKEKNPLEISDTMRNIFTQISNVAQTDTKDLLGDMLKEFKKKKKTDANKIIASKLLSYANKTFETAVDVFINTAISIK